MDASWYDVVDGPDLSQGDLLLQCPVFVLAETPNWPLRPPADVRLQAQIADLVVMTQSCDLDNDKLQEVLFARVQGGLTLSGPRPGAVTSSSRGASSGSCSSTETCRAFR